MMAHRIRHDIIYKERVLCNPIPKQSLKFRTFLKDTKEIINKVLDQLDSLLIKRGKKESKGAITSMCINRLKKNKGKLSFSFGKDSDIDESDEEVKPEKSFLHNRGKSCFCQSCGGFSYYHKFQKKINMHKLKNEKPKTFPTLRAQRQSQALLGSK
jgi:hypothetical protein